MHYLRRITSAAALFALAILWSNVWGQVRESLSLRWFKPEPVAAYLMALMVPFQAPQVLTTALIAAMVPVLVNLRSHGRSDEALRVGRIVALIVGAVLLPITVLAWLAPNWLLHLIFYFRQDSPEVLNQATSLSRILFPYLWIATVSGTITAILQAYEKFRPLAAGQLLPNLCIVLWMVAFHASQGIRSQAVGVVLGGIAYLLLVGVCYGALEKSEIGHHSSTKRAPWWQLESVRQIGMAIIPLLLVGLADWGTTGLSIFRAVSWVQEQDPDAARLFQSAYRILQIPQGVFITAVAMVMLPYLSGLASKDEHPRLATATVDGVRMVVYLVAPTIIVLAALALPILNVLYRGGEYSPTLAVRASELALWMAPYVLFSSVGEVLILVLLATRRVWILLAVQAWSLIISLILSHSLAVAVGLPGVALAVSLVALATLLLLLFAVRPVIERGGALSGWQERVNFLWKVSASCIVVALALICERRILELGSPIGSPRRSLLEIAVSILLAGIVYAGMSEWLRLPEWRQLRDSVFRWRGSREHPKTEREPESERRLEGA